MKCTVVKRKLEVMAKTGLGGDKWTMKTGQKLFQITIKR